MAKSLPQESCRLPNGSVEALNRCRIVQFFNIPIEHEGKVDPTSGEIETAGDRAGMRSGGICVACLAESRYAERKADQVINVADGKNSSELFQRLTMGKELSLEGAREERHQISRRRCERFHIVQERVSERAGRYGGQFIPG